jgi:hypothetical protein
MNPVRRFPFVARLLSVGLIAGSMFGIAPIASAAPIPGPVPSGTRLPDLTVAVSASPSSVAHGGTHTYVLRVTNITWGPAGGAVLGASLSNVRVHLNGYPSDEQLLSFHDDSNAGFICYTPAEYFGMAVECVGGTVPSLSTAQITITMRAPSTVGTFTSTATVDPYNAIAESNENNNTATISFSTI